MERRASIRTTWTIRTDLAVQSPSKRAMVSDLVHSVITDSPGSAQHDDIVRQHADLSSVHGSVSTDQYTGQSHGTVPAC
ncbi:hypothetical protein IGI04_043019 [Brassica rapa subsp. trilocularis]|uniref:Uncharacterized protein n=1 Tax=Brassica rapa subsp. trilocularis TaxID=1813537 RepID=A0ABQ7KHZ0_BRACM|nr:hypothetical protein IGI04_043019 [Brassica rapa subsp. trilocularis]